MQPAIFLDRDGVINEDISVDSADEVTSLEKVKLYPNINKFLETAKRNGYKIIVVTNQSKIGRGLITLEELNKINDFVHKSTGSHIHKFYFCPHTKEESCDCRKPKNGMILRAAKEHSIDLKNSWMIGDKTIDVKAGKDSGMKTILVKTGYGGSDKVCDVKPDYVAENLEDAGKIIFSS